MTDQQEMTLERTYVIATVADFAKVPKDRIRACLSEFATALEIQADATDTLSAIGEAMVGAKDAVKLVMDRFEWTDDGLGKIAIEVEEVVNAGSQYSEQPSRGEK